MNGAPYLDHKSAKLTSIMPIFSDSEVQHIFHIIGFPELIYKHLKCILMKKPDAFRNPQFDSKEQTKCRQISNHPNLS